VADAPRSAAHGRVPFWAHQLAELLLGVVLLFEGARNGTHVAVMAAGGALLLFTLVTDGPLAAWPRLPRRAHRIGDFGFAGLLAVSPLLVGADDVLAIVLLEVAAVVMLWLALRGDFRPPKARRPRRDVPPPAAARPAAPAPASSAPAGDPEPAPRSAPNVSVPSARDAGRALGRLRTGGVRAVGRAVGRASAERASEQASDAGATGPQAGAPAPPRPAGNGREDLSPE
jgi:hypothetical protein